MAQFPLKLIPGVNVEVTETLNQAGVSACNLIRYKAQLPQKLGGWEKYFASALDGIPRDIHAWQDLNTIGHLAVGTTTELDVITDGSLDDISPQQLISDFTPDFTTTASSVVVEIDDPNIADVTVYDSVFFNTPVSVGGIILSGFYPITLITGTTTYQINASMAAAGSVAGAGAVPEFDTASGSSIVTVTLDDHGLAADGTVVFQIPTTVGGITIDGAYSVTAINSADEFTITTDTQATSTTSAFMNSGDAQLVYYITLGAPAAGIGYGLGNYGEGTYGLGVVPSAQTGTPITATSWTMDNWGEILLSAPFEGAIYSWQPNGIFVNASVVSSGPPFNGGIFIAMPQQILVAWGSSVVEDIGVRRDPLLVRWSDFQDFSEWTVSALTQAGSQRLTSGSKIVGGLQGPQQALIWTDIDVWAMSYLGPPLIFGFNKLSSGCGLIGPHAAAVMRGVVYWMSVGNFFALTGSGIQPIPCSVWDVVFQDLDTTNQHKCVAAPTSSFDEIRFDFPSLSGGSGENDSYVKYNIVERTWDYGQFPIAGRSAWTDQSVLGEPIGTTPTGIVYQHETTFDADGQALHAWFETGWFVIAEGQSLSFVDWFFPDMKFGVFGGDQDASVQVTITATDYPNGPERVFGPFTMTIATTYVNTRLRGRQIKVKFSSSDLGSFWRLGLMRYRVAQDGRR